MLKAVIFDMDGVIFDSEPIHLAMEQGIFRSFGIDLTKEEHNTYVGTTSHYMWEMIKKRHKIIHSIEELVELDRGNYFKYISRSDINISSIDGVDNFIQELKYNNIKLAVASSSPMNVIDRIISLFNLKKYFDVLVTGDFVDKSKPEPDIFLYAAHKLGFKPEECLVVEDSYNGVTAAKRAGMKCVGYINGNSGNQDLSSSDIAIDDYSKITVDDLHNLFI